MREAFLGVVVISEDISSLDLGTAGFVLILVSEESGLPLTDSILVFLNLKVGAGGLTKYWFSVRS